ncbi:MAG: hypothetical protein IMF01_09345 [Proteobacteria bacterium]|nr:hypothetical protein [Pseudomonadota bacterium]
MKNFLLLVCFLITSFNAFALKTTDNFFYVGKNAGADFTILHKDGGYLKKLGSQGSWLFSNDGILEKKIGSGAGTGGSGGVNILLNSSFEDGLGEWTTFAGTLTQESYVSSVEGDTKYARFISTIAGEFVEQTILSFPSNISNGCMADFRYIQGDSAFDYKVIEDLAGTPKELSSGSITDLTSWQKAPTATFPCPTAGVSLTLRIISTGAGTIDFDDAYLGSNKGFISGTYTNTVFLEGNGGEVITLNTQDIPFAGSATGWASDKYTVQRNSSIVKISGSVNITVSVAYKIALYKNGTLYKEVSDRFDSPYRTIEYISTAGEFLKDDELSFRMDSTRQLLNDSVKHYLNILEQSSETQEAFTPEEAGFYLDVSIGGADLSISDTVGGHVTFESASLDMVLNKGSAKIPCSSTNISTSLTCSVGNENVGAVFNAPRAGTYKICGQWMGGINATGAYRWAETADGSQSIIQLGRGVAGGSSMAASAVNQENLCSLFTFSSAGEKAIRLFYIGNSAVVAIRASRSTALYNDDINITVELVDHNVSRPIIQNMTDTSIDSGIRTDACKVNNNGAASVDVASGLCASWLTLATRSSLGIVDMTVSGFSAVPVCECSPEGVDVSCSIVENSATSITSKIKTHGGSFSDVNFSVSCKGKR